VESRPRAPARYARPHQLRPNMMYLTPCQIRPGVPISSATERPPALENRSPFEARRGPLDADALPRPTPRPIEKTPTPLPVGRGRQGRLRRSGASLQRNNGGALGAARLVPGASRVDQMVEEERAIRVEVLRCLVRLCGTGSRAARTAGTQRAGRYVRQRTTWIGPTILETRARSAVGRPPRGRRPHQALASHRRPTCG